MDNVYEGFCFFNTLPSDRHLDIGHHVSTSYCRCSSGDGVDLLSRTINFVPPWLLVIGVSSTSLIIRQSKRCNEYLSDSRETNNKWKYLSLTL